jgi:hypothetical protein
MTELSLTEAQQQRRDELLDEELGTVLDRIFSEADTVGPDARHKLRGILKHYAKEPHPFRACVKDNMKRFGPGRTEAVCATLKDVIRGTTHWRGHPGADHGSPGAIAASDNEPITLSDAERREILVGLSDEDWTALEEAIHG